MNNSNINNNGLTSGMIFLLAFACGSIVANLYYSQTIVVLIGKHFNLNLQLTGLIVTLTQVGYCIGLLFIVPLADIIENKRLIIVLLILTFMSLLGIVLTNTITFFLLFSFLLGITTVVPQVIIPFVAHLTPLEKRGKVVGNVMSGLLLGIMLARPMASWIAGVFNWHAIFILSAILMLIIATLFYRLVPTRVPEQKISYIKLISSLPVILKSYPSLQRRAIYQAVLFGIFSLFWTSIAMLLMGEYHHYSQTQVALFAFVGAAGAVVAPIAGRIADKGRTKIATGIAIILVCVAFLLAKLDHGHSIVLLIISALILDAGIACNLVLGQRTIYSLAPEIRSRLNGLYMSIFFMGGAIGSGFTGYLYAHGEWDYITNTGITVSILLFLYFLTECFKPRELVTSQL